MSPRDATSDTFNETDLLPGSAAARDGAVDESSNPPDYVALRRELMPDGLRTRLGDALLSVVNQERGGPIAGIVLLTDGQKTVGGDVETAIATAREAGIPLISIGLGRPDRPQNVRISEIQAPQRAYPGDKFTVKGVIQSVGMAGTKVDVRLYSVDAAEQEAETLEAEIAVDLGEDGEPIAVDVEIENSETGQRRYIMRVLPPSDDINQDDNERSALVEIVRRKNRVLMIAGGPTREFRFLRNQLFRDDTVQLDVYLQSARPGIAQEADELLFDFPTLKENLYEYDCIVAFDPDWRVLDETQARLLEQWIAEEAGGLIVVAGPVFTPEWTRRPRGDAVIRLDPSPLSGVVLQSRFRFAPFGTIRREESVSIEVQPRRAFGKIPLAA